MSLHKNVHTKRAKLVDEKNDQLFCCLSVHDFQLKILFKGAHLTKFWRKKMVNRKVYCLSKKQKYVCHRIPFNSVLKTRKIFSFPYLIIKPVS